MCKTINEMCGCIETVACMNGMAGSAIGTSARVNRIKLWD